MIVIAEGPDNSGKSTQLQRVQQRLAKKGKPTHYLHYSAFKLPKEECIAYSKKVYEGAFQLIDNAISLGQSLIFDRLTGGEWVYGKIYRDYDAEYIYELEDEYIRSVDQNLKHTYLIVFTDKAENLITRDDGLSYTSDMGWNMAMQKKEYELARFYDFFLRSLIKNKLYLPITGLDPDQVEERIVNFLGV